MAVPRDVATAADFIMVRAALVRLLGGANEALVWTRVQYRCEVNHGATYEADGECWWITTKETVAEETGLSPDQARRALDALVAGGFLASEYHRTKGNYDRTKSYRPIWQDDQMHLADLPNGSGEDAKSHLANLPDVPTHQNPRRTTKNVGKAAVAMTEGARSSLPLCEALQRAIVANGSKEPTISKAWLDAARLLIDRDGRTPAQVSNMIAWCQADEFWRGNILSMPTLRTKYDQMRLQAMRASAPRQSVVEQGRAVDEELRRREEERERARLSQGELQ